MLVGYYIELWYKITYPTRSAKLAGAVGSTTSSTFIGRLSTSTPLYFWAAVAAWAARINSTVAIPRDWPLGP